MQSVSRLYLDPALPQQLPHPSRTAAGGGGWNSRGLSCHGLLVFPKQIVTGVLYL